MGDSKSPLWEFSSEVRAAPWRVIHICVVSLRLNCVAAGRETLSRVGYERTEVTRTVGTRERTAGERMPACAEN